MFYTYSIKNIENGKFYIGSRTAKCMLNRKPEDDLGIKYFSSSKDKELRKAIKDGKVEYHVLKEYDNIDICWRAEQQLIALYWKFFGKDMSYNHCYSKCNGDKVFSVAGIQMKESTKEKLSEAHKGKQFSEEHKQKLSEVRKGKHHSDETKKKIGEASKGRYYSDDARKKIGEAHKGKSTFKGKHHSDTTKQKMSEAHKGKPKQKFYWQTTDGKIKIMDKSHVSIHHVDWTLIGPVENKENN